MIGFVDESLRQGPDGLYLVAVVVLAPAGAEMAAERVRSVLLPRQPRFHWHAESDRQRRRMLDTMVELDVGVRAYVMRLTGRSERARALLLNRALWDLAELGVAELVLESRQEHNDVRDRRIIAAAQRAGMASPELVYRHERPHSEPLLWLPDAAAGAVAAAVAGETSSYVEVLERGRLVVVEVGP